MQKKSFLNVFRSNTSKPYVILYAIFKNSSLAQCLHLLPDNRVVWLRKQIVTGQIFVSKPPHISFAIWTCIISPKGHFSILFFATEILLLGIPVTWEVKSLIWEWLKTINPKYNFRKINQFPITCYLLNDLPNDFKSAV